MADPTHTHTPDDPEVTGGILAGMTFAQLAEAWRQAEVQANRPGPDGPRDATTEYQWAVFGEMAVRPITSIAEASVLLTSALRYAELGWDGEERPQDAAVRKVQDFLEREGRKLATGHGAVNLAKLSFGQLAERWRDLNRLTREASSHDDILELLTERADATAEEMARRPVTTADQAIVLAEAITNWEAGDCMQPAAQAVLEFLRGLPAPSEPVD